MPRYGEELLLDLSLEDSREACREGIVAVGWALQYEGEARLVCKEVSDPAPWLSGHWAVQVEILLHETTPSRTQVVFNGSNRGMCPIQSNHVKDQVSKLRSQIASIANRRQVPARSKTTGSVSSELEKLGHLHAQGVLTDEEFSRAKSRLLDG